MRAKYTVKATSLISSLLNVTYAHAFTPPTAATIHAPFSSYCFTTAIGFDLLVTLDTSYVVVYLGKVGSLVVSPFEYSSAANWLAINFLIN